MGFAYEKLRGLDRDRLMQVIDPVLRAHQLDGVEAIWRTDNRGWVLYLTVEKAGQEAMGAGVTLDECSELSRDLSTALDVADLIAAAYRLEVGSPGLERQLYQLSDYRRFVGQCVKLRCTELVSGQKTLRGTLLRLTDSDEIVLDSDQGELCVPFNKIEAGQLVLLMGPAQKPGAKSKAKVGASKTSAKSGSSAEGLSATEFTNQSSSASPAIASPEDARAARAPVHERSATASDSTRPS